MARNPKRRNVLVDAGLAVLAEHGSRGLTHRAIDERTGLPQGTCVNYFRSRDALFEALGNRIFERLTPSPTELKVSAGKRPSKKRFLELMHELVDRVDAEPELQIALLELRLESTRRPTLAATLAATLQAALALDMQFHRAARLPGGELEIKLLHLAIGGLILNTITLPNVLEVAQKNEIVDQLVSRLLTPPKGRR